jgi:hypothetical protein
MPTELTNMLFGRNLITAKRKEERALKIAQQVMGSAVYGDSSNIALPLPSAKAVEGIRRISPKKDYASIRSIAVPPYSVSRFVEDIKNACFRL